MVVNAEPWKDEEGKPIINAEPWEHPKDRVEKVEIQGGTTAYFHRDLEHPIIIAGGVWALRLQGWLLRIANKVSSSVTG